MKKTNFLISIFIFAIFITISCNSSTNSNNNEANNDETNTKDTTAEEVVNLPDIEIDDKEDLTKEVKELLTSITEPYDIKDYFLLLPDELILEINALDRKKILEIKDFRESHESGIFYYTETIDVKNAFLRVKSAGDGDGNNIEMTYFVKSDKTRLIAVNIIYWNMLTETSDLYFYTYSNKKWTDVTADVIPEINMASFSTAKVTVDNVAITVLLPQNGKTIKVALDAEILPEFYDYTPEYEQVKDNLFCTKYDLIWNDGTFSIANKTNSKN